MEHTSEHAAATNEGPTEPARLDQKNAKLTDESLAHEARNSGYLGQVHVARDGWQFAIPRAGDGLPTDIE